MRRSLVVHYHRTNHDYASWRLLLSTSGTTVSLSPVSSVTSFGLLFRHPLPSDSLSLLPHHPVHPLDHPARTFIPRDSRRDVHVFIAEADSAAYEDIHLFRSSQSASRFVPVIAPPAARPPFLLLISPPVKRHLFPAARPHRLPHVHTVYLVDTVPFPSGRLHLALVHSHDDALCVNTPADAHAAFTLPSTDARSLYLDLDGDRGCLLSDARADVPRVLDLLKAQAEATPGMSPCEQVHASLTHAHGPAQEEMKVAPLCVYVRGGGGEGIVTALDVAIADGNGKDAAPRAVLQSRRYHGALVFEIDLDSVPASVLQAGLRICAAHQGKLGRERLWTPALGMHVVLANTFSELLPAERADLTVYYHRFGAFEDWYEWELHVWSEATEAFAAVSTMVRAGRPLRSGTVLFEVEAELFPEGSVVRAEPVRTSVTPGRVIVNEFGEEHCGEERRDASRRDVVRKWVSGELTSGVVHMVQGDEKIRERAPTVSEMDGERNIRLRYRRHAPDDHGNWTLWTWDHTDPEVHYVSVLPESAPTKKWVDFVVDRAAYGSGAEISIVPRRGKDEWEERDEPVRLWTKSLLEHAASGRGGEIVDAAMPGGQTIDHRDGGGGYMPTSLIIEGVGKVFKHLEEARQSLVAYASSPNLIVLQAEAPFEWISPACDSKTRGLSSTEVKVYEEAIHSLIARGRSVDDNSGTTLPFMEAQRTSPTEARLVFEDSIVEFNEDYRVENIVISVPGFDSKILAWRVYEDWNKYLYTGSLGWEYEAEKCSFRCFSPTADQVNVVLYNFAEGVAGRRVVRMRRIPEGCWKAIVYENLKGKFYKLLAEGSDKRLFPGVEVIDPYSRCNTSHVGRGLIFGIEDTEIFPRPNIPPHEAIVYELHVRDLTIDKDAGVVNRGKFKGLSERGRHMITQFEDEGKKPLTLWKKDIMPDVDPTMSTMSKVSTGLDHIVQMGVNTVQLLPVQDFDNDEADDSTYNWGYMPVHFNSPDGWFASETKSAARVTEFKQVVDAVHRAGLKLIMDVVYNHTAEDGNELNLEARFSFNGIAPRYYYRTCGNNPIAHTGDSTCAVRKSREPKCGECYSNGSGCGNEFRSESPMGRKFIIDSLKYWATEYKVDGFRFDLLGLVDVETLAEASSVLKSVDPNIMIYGEPWAGGLSPLKITEKGAQRSKGFGVFNNSFRDAIRGSHFNVEETFVMDGGRVAEVKGGIIGSVNSFCDRPLETVNYVECHDNYTLWDHMGFYVRSRTDNIEFTDRDMRRMHRLAAAIILTSQGIPFMQVGQEMCRTKFGVENSYNSPDKINMVRWKTKLSEWNTVLYYRGLVLLRRSHPEIFCLETADRVYSAVTFYEDLGLAVPERCIAYRISGDTEKLYSRMKRNSSSSDETPITEESMRWSAVVVLLNPTPIEVIFELPEQNCDGVWIQIVGATTAGLQSIKAPVIGTVAVEGRSAAVLRRASQREEKGFLTLQRLAAISDSYCSFHGDDFLGRYAVGLDKQMSTTDAANREQLVLRREQFQRNRLPTRDKGLYFPSLNWTEALAIAAVDRKHGKA